MHTANTLFWSEGSRVTCQTTALSYSHVSPRHAPPQGHTEPPALKFHPGLHPKLALSEFPLGQLTALLPVTHLWPSCIPSRTWFWLPHQQRPGNLKIPQTQSAEGLGPAACCCLLLLQRPLLLTVLWFLLNSKTREYKSHFALHHSLVNLFIMQIAWRKNNETTNDNT